MIGRFIYNFCALCLLATGAASLTGCYDFLKPAARGNYVVSSIVTQRSGSAVPLSAPYGFTLGAHGAAYVSDYKNHVIYQVDLVTGALRLLAGDGAPGFLDSEVGEGARFNTPSGLALDNANGILYVADEKNHRIRTIILATGKVSTLAGNGKPSLKDGSAASASFHSPADVAFDGSDNIYVADFGNRAIRRVVVSTGAVSALAGNISYPAAIVLDGAGGAYVAARGSHCILRVGLATGVISGVAGGVDQVGYVNAKGSEARFNSPSGLALDRYGNLYVADFGNHRIRKVTASGEVTSIAGSGVLGHADGPADNAQFFRPIGMAIDNVGNIYVADQLSALIRKIAPR